VNARGKASPNRARKITFSGPSQHGPPRAARHAHTRKAQQSRGLLKKYRSGKSRNTTENPGFIPFESAGSTIQASAEEKMKHRSTAMKIATFAFATALAFTPVALFAQNIQDRKENQQDRIAQGVKSNNLSAGETARLEHQEAGINQEEHGMRAQDNGKLTAQDRKTINHQQNIESKRIYRTKRDIGHK
jgi:uncharacterized protein HemX